MEHSRCLSDVGIVVMISTLLVVSLCGTIPTVNEKDELPWTGETTDVRSDQSGEFNPFDVVQEISAQITVPAGREYYVVYDSASQTLTEIPIASPTVGFPQSALDAIDRSPNWIKDNLTSKFEQMADEPIKVTAYAAPDFADLDADGDLDLIVGTENDGLMYFENIEEGLHYYEGYDVYVGCVLVSNTSMFGPLALTRADPALADLDGDNDLDILIGVSTGVWKLMNVGLPDAPSWGSIESTSISLPYSAIDLGDVDADGDPDMVIGNRAGELYLSINQAADPQHISDGDPATTTTSVFSSPIYLNLDVEDYASPALGDVDFDGDLDMVSGNFSGGLSFHENIWTPDNPFWTPNNATVFGEIDFGANSMPTFADVDLDMLQEIAIGDVGGYVHYIPNAGTASDPKFLIWDNVKTSFNSFNRDYYYIDDSDVLLKERTIPAKMIDYVNLINSVPDHMVDELAFSVANTATSSLMHSATYPDAYRNNTEALYYNDMFIDYADILDLGDFASGDYYSTLRYWVNESGTRVEYIVPTDVYYWDLAHPRVSYELPTFINPNVVTNLHIGAAAAPPAGKFWRWYLFNENDTAWPLDPGGAFKYPKDESPPLMKEKLAGVTTVWNVTNHISPAGYGDDGHNNSRPWNYSDHAVETVSHWVSLTLALNAQEDDDNGLRNRPRQPVRIAHEHNGNCGELHDLTTAAFRAALIPAIGVMSAAEDHCWNEFWHDGWQHLDNYWSNGASIIGNNDFKHYPPGWNRDWTAIYGVEGDTRVVNHIDKYHHEEDYNGDGFQDRGNVSVKVVDANGNPVDGAKVSIAGWSFGPPYSSIGDFSTYTGPDGVAFFTTSESRQNDTFDDGIQIDVSSKFGGGSLNPGYANRYKICIDPPNLPLYSYQYQVAKTVPRPWLEATPTAPPQGEGYWLDVDFDVRFGVQHPLADATSHADDQFDGDRVAHPEYFWDNITLDTFVADEQNFLKYVRGEAFDSTNLSLNVSSGSVFLGLPSSGNWYFVLSNRDSLETKKIVNITIRLIEDLRPGVPHITRGAFTGVSQEDVTLTWERSTDDGQGEDDILAYTVHRALDYHGPYSQVDAIAADGRLYYNWTDPGLGIGDLTDYFYHIVCHDNLSAMRSPETVGKLVQYMYPGANLLSVPVYTEDDSVPAVLATVGFNEVRLYDASDVGDPWKSYHKAKYINDLQGVRPLDGIWVNALSEGNLTVIGLILPYHSIDLQQGWNLVGYPSFNASYTVGDLKAELGAMRVEGFDPSSPPYFMKVLPDAYVLKAGESYWIELPSPMTWNIDT
ncbi:MAG: FG-GAP-like repeat-containing protein [Candidatus Thermoplasmatota archaeon]|nr:FG-GAP-like repeat-containing protein [Candidatus Thermoplasmatota archaeon]